MSKITFDEIYQSDKVFSRGVIMLEKNIQTVRNILAMNNAGFKTVTIELFNLIFQQKHDQPTRLQLFMEVVRIYDLWSQPGEFPIHIFTAELSDEQIAKLDPARCKILINDLRAIKNCYPGAPEKAAAAVFQMIDEQTNQKFNFFQVFFFCGYFPFKSNQWVLFEHNEPKIADAESLRAFEMMHRACWSLQDNEHLLLNYASNLLGELANNPIARRGALAQLMTFMKDLGREEVIVDEERVQDNIDGPSVFSVSDDNGTKRPN